MNCRLLSILHFNCSVEMHSNRAGFGLVRRMCGRIHPRGSGNKQKILLQEVLFKALE